MARTINSLQMKHIDYLPKNSTLKGIKNVTGELMMKPTILLSLKIYFSLLWRTILVTLITGAIIMASAFTIMMIFLAFQGSVNQYHLENTLFAKIAIFLVGTVAFTIITLFINKWVINELPKISYKEGQVQLMLNETQVDSFSLFDTLCVTWSQIWRGIILSIPVTFVTFLLFADHTILDYMSITSFQDNHRLTIQIMNIIAGILAIYWMLLRKQTGRWLKLVPKSESSEGDA